MPWVKGQSGNPAGRISDKEYAGALRAALNAEDPVTRRRKLLLIAEKAVDLAVLGEPWAIAHVADRLDGKPAQESTVTLRNELDQMTDVELRDFIRRELEAVRESSAAPSQSPDPRIFN